MKLFDTIAGMGHEQLVVCNDTSAGYLWRDEEIIRYLNSAVDEACERALLLEDRSSAACCQSDLDAAETTYALHPSVIAAATSVR